MTLSSDYQTISSKCIQQAIRPVGDCETNELQSEKYYSLAKVSPNAIGRLVSRRAKDLAWQIDYLTKLYNRVDSPRVLNALILAWQAKADYTRASGDTRGMGHCSKKLAALNVKALAAV